MTSQFGHLPRCKPCTSVLLTLMTNNINRFTSSFNVLNYLGQGSHPLAEVISSNLATHSGPLFLRFHVHFGWRF